MYGSMSESMLKQCPKKFVEERCLAVQSIFDQEYHI